MGPGGRAKPGGIGRVEAILDAHPLTVEADLHRYYRLDVRDLWRPGGGQSRMTYRMLGSLIDGLPGESLTKTAIRDAIPADELAAMAKQRSEGHGPWSHEALLLAAVLDVLRTFMWLFGTSKGATKTPAPEPYPRPGVAARRRRALTQEGFTYLQQIRQRHAELHGYSEDDTGTG